MANNYSEPSTDDFLDHLLGIPPYAPTAHSSGLTTASDVGMDGGAQRRQPHMMLQLSSGDCSSHVGAEDGADFHGPMFPSGLSLDQARQLDGFLKPVDSSGSGKRFRAELLDNRIPTTKNTFNGLPMLGSMGALPHPHVVRPRVRARRGQATDPHSIAERVRREKIAERIRGLQELVPSVNKMDRAAMLDEIVDYVKFLRLQVKVLSMSRLGGAGAVAPLVTDIPVSSLEEEGSGGGRIQPAWEKWSNDGTERQVAKLMEENVGAAMQFLQSKALCIMPISLASAIYHAQPPDSLIFVKPENDPPP